MKPSILLAGVGLFLLSLFVHVVIWRFWHPRRHALALFIIFIMPLFLLAFALSIVWTTFQWLDFASVALLHLALSFAYIQTYPAVQALSPSLRILILVRASMPAGMKEAEIFECFDSKQILDDRIHDLTISHLASETNGVLEITAKGRLFILPFLALRKILGLAPGKG